MSKSVLVNIGYPSREATRDMLYAQAIQHPLETLGAVVSGEEIAEIQRTVREVSVEESVAGYMIELAEQTREDQRLKLGVSPRGALMLFRAAQASAAQQGRDYVLPDDVQRMTPYVIPHRVMLTSKAKYGGTLKQEVVSELLDLVNVPT